MAIQTFTTAVEEGTLGGYVAATHMNREAAVRLADLLREYGGCGFSAMENRLRNIADRRKEDRRKQ